MGPILQHLFFIINPIAGPGETLLNRAYIMDFFKGENRTITIKNTKYRSHARELAKEAIEAQVDLVVACGGDGTVNEVASVLLGSEIPLGIIPMGSGNGLASNLNIPKNLNNALALIKKPRIIHIDAGCVNKRFFFSNMGIGFDAEVIGHYEQINTRGFFAYLKAAFLSLKSFSYEEYAYKIGKVKTAVAPFLLFVSNSNEMGNRITLTPQASLQDGLLDIIVVPKISRLRAVLFGLLMFFKNHHSLKELRYYQEEGLTIYSDRNEPFRVQVDGEFVTFEEDELNVSIKKAALRVVTGKPVRSTFPSSI